MNDQNAADKDLLTIEELAAHAMKSEQQEAEASAPSDAVADEEDEAPVEEDEENTADEADDEAGDEQEEDEDAADDEAGKPKAAARKKAAAASSEGSEEKESLSQKLRDFVDDEEVKPFKIGPLFKALVGGDGLSRIIARNWLFITVLVFFSCCYVSSRYMMQNATLERNALTRTLADRKYKALTASSEYLEKTRSHYIESNLKDTTIHSSTDLPFALKIEQEDRNE